MQLFNNQSLIELPDARILFLENFFDPFPNESGFPSSTVSDRLFANLKQNIAWQQGEITIFGRRVAEPRLSAWYGDAGKSYTYSGKTQQPLPWNDTLLYIKNAVELQAASFELQATSLQLVAQGSQLDAHSSQLEASFFNSVLCNFYRNGNDSMGFHADDERELGRNPTIASVNFGETRRFIIRRRDDKTVKFELALTHGSLLIMSGAMQHHWHHAVQKEPRRTALRINLTFRHIF